MLNIADIFIDCPEFMTAKQVMTILQIGDKKQLYDLIQARKIVAFRIGRNYKIPKLLHRKNQGTEGKIKLRDLQHKGDDARKPLKIRLQNRVISRIQRKNHGRRLLRQKHERQHRYDGVNQPWPDAPHFDHRKYAKEGCDHRDRQIKHVY